MKPSLPRHRYMHGRWDDALLIMVCTDHQYMGVVLENLATAMANSIYPQQHMSAWPTDCIVVPTGHETYQRIAGVRVKLGELDTRFDDLAAAKRFVAEFRFEQEMAA